MEKMANTISGDQVPPILKELYLAMVQAYMTDAIRNLRSTDEDKDPKTAEAVYHAEIAIAHLLRAHLNIESAEMTELLPTNFDLPSESRGPEYDANAVLFFFGHLHRIIFRPGEPHPAACKLSG